MVRDPRRRRSLLRYPQHCVVDQSLSDFPHPQILPIHSPELPLMQFFLLPLTFLRLHVLINTGLVILFRVWDGMTRKQVPPLSFAVDHQGGFRSFWRPNDRKPVPVMRPGFLNPLRAARLPYRAKSQLPPGWTSEAPTFLGESVYPSGLADLAGWTTFGLRQSACTCRKSIVVGLWGEIGLPGVASYFTLLVARGAGRLSGAVKSDR